MDLFASAKPDARAASVSRVTIASPPQSTCKPSFPIERMGALRLP